MKYNSQVLNLFFNNYKFKLLQSYTIKNQSRQGKLVNLNKKKHPIKDTWQ
jgi:hypothetical protein